ncbi:MAG: type II methionyl aminopeptidase, partial [Candidatus Methanofastidiosia archaeon]
VNVSINQNAAHDTADFGDERTFKEGDLIKLDAGVQIDGYIADSARTVSLNSGKEEMIKASEKALEEALKMMKPGVKVYEVSGAIEDTIKDMGFIPVINLTGHGLDKYELHARIEFPNVRPSIDYELKEDEVYAIEPFSSEGAGKVIESNRIYIYRYLRDMPVRFPESRQILKIAREDFHSLPFTKRWIIKKLKISPLKLNLILKQLVQKGSLYDYPVLKDAGNGYVAQKEHTVIVGDKPIITTK